MHSDNQGSVLATTNASGHVMTQDIYDPFGKQGEVYRAPVYLTSLPPITDKGYTGHKQMNHVDIIHMNGRVYDYNVGRFLSVDPVIQGAGSQGINPYSYIMNNPMAGTDPSGYIACGMTENRCEQPTAQSAMYADAERTTAMAQSGQSYIDKSKSKNANGSVELVSLKLKDGYALEMPEDIGSHTVIATGGDTSNIIDGSQFVNHPSIDVGHTVNASCRPPSMCITSVPSDITIAQSRLDQRRRRIHAPSFRRLGWHTL